MKSLPAELVKNAWWNAKKPQKKLTKKQKEKLWKVIYSKCQRPSTKPDVFFGKEG